MQLTTSRATSAKLKIRAAKSLWMSGPNWAFLYYRFPEVEGVGKFALEREYKNRDVITVSPEKMGDVYKEKVKMFFIEHLHEDEEIRYILDGNGYFDVCSEGDKLIRIRLDAFDAIVLPSESTIGSQLMRRM